MLYDTKNVTLNQRARETLVRARRWLIEDGWSKGSMHNADGWCLAGAMTAVWDDEFGEEELIRAENVLAHLADDKTTLVEFAGGSRRRDLFDVSEELSGTRHRDVSMFNDLPSTTLVDVLELIDLGIGLLDQTIVDPCRCDFQTMLVVVGWETDQYVLRTNVDRELVTVQNRDF